MRVWKEVEETCGHATIITRVEIDDERIDSRDPQAVHRMREMMAALLADDEQPEDADPEDSKEAWLHAVGVNTNEDN